MTPSGRARIREAIRKLPRDIDPVAAADVALEILVDSAWQFSRDCKRLPIAVIREVLGRRPVDAAHVFLTLAVDPDGTDAALAAAWAEAIQGLADLETINRWGSPQRRAKISGLASNRQLLPAIQGAAANGTNVSSDMLAVLVADGSPESLDALVPHLDHADRVHRLDALRMLRVHARDTPALRTLFAELDRDANVAAASAHVVAKLVGLPAAEVFWFDASIWSEVAGHAIAPIQAYVAIDSRKARWFHVQVSKIAKGTVAGRTWISSEDSGDELGLGRCEPTELPAWFAAVGKKLRITWAAPTVRSNVRGSRRDAIARWLLPARRR